MVSKKTIDFRHRESEDSLKHPAISILAAHEFSWSIPSHNYVESQANEMDMDVK
jgi:hypothetical protein